MQYNTIQYNTIQYNTIQYNTIQYNTIQYIVNTFNTIHNNLLDLHFHKKGWMSPHIFISVLPDFALAK